MEGFPRKTGRFVPCAKCGTLFRMAGPRSKYCSDLCRASARRVVFREYLARHRELTGHGTPGA